MVIRAAAPSPDMRKIVFRVIASSLFFFTICEIITPDKASTAKLIRDEYAGSLRSIPVITMHIHRPKIVMESLLSTVLIVFILYDLARHSCGNC